MQRLSILVLLHLFFLMLQFCFICFFSKRIDVTMSCHCELSCLISSDYELTSIFSDLHCLWPFLSRISTTVISQIRWYKFLIISDAEMSVNLPHCISSVSIASNSHAYVKSLPLLSRNLSTVVTAHDCFSAIKYQYCILQWTWRKVPRMPPSNVISCQLQLCISETTKFYIRTLLSFLGF